MYKLLLKISRGVRSKLIAIFAIGVADVFLTLLFVWSSKELVDIATGASSRSFVLLASLLALQVLMQISLRGIEIKVVNLTEVKLANSMRSLLFDHLLHAEWRPVISLERGDMLTRMIKDTDDLVKLLTYTLPSAIAAILQLIGGLIFFFILDWKLALVITLIMPLLLLFSRLYYRPMKRYTKEVKESESSITSHVEESMANQLVIRTFERQYEELEKLDELQEQLHHKVEKRTRVSIFARMIGGLAFQGGYLLAFIHGAKGLAGGTISYGMLTAFLQLVGRIQRPLFELTRLVPALISAKTASDRVMGIKGIEREQLEELIAITEPLSLQVRNLNFSYESDTPLVIENLSFTLSPGEVVAVMGESGAGKSTFARLLLGLVKPHSGTIELATSTDLKTANHQQPHRWPVGPSTRSNFVYVPQENLLFSGTIRENLLVGNPNATDSELQKVLEIASATFVFDLPGGLESTIGESKVGLSEGQAQRLSIARALLRPGKILLLDEATSALDSNTESAFLANLKEHLQGRSVLFITHHKEVAEKCDYIITLS
ncbi:MAG: ABC transporter ATP-binding protein [Bacteroidales bacterium]